MNKYKVESLVNSSEHHEINADDFRIDHNTIVFYVRVDYGVHNIAAFPANTYKVLKIDNNENNR